MLLREGEARQSIELLVAPVDAGVMKDLEGQPEGLVRSSSARLNTSCELLERSMKQKRELVDEDTRA